MNVRLPYAYLLEACSKPSLVKECGYDFWREKAYREGFPRWFFDLAGERSSPPTGGYRYLELVSPLSFPPQCLAFYDRGELYGVYESYYGLWLALYRVDKPAMDFFFRSLDAHPEDFFWLPERLTPVEPPKEGVNYLYKLLGLPHDKVRLGEMEYVDPSLPENTLLGLVEEGDGRAFMILAERGWSFPLALSVARSGSMVFATRLPIPELGREEKEGLVLAAATSGVYKALRFYQDKTGVSLSSLEVPPEVIKGIKRSILLRGDSYSTYEVVKELPGSTMGELARESFGMTADIALLILSKDSTGVNYFNLILYNLGNLDLVLTLLPLAPHYPGICADLREQEEYFPLGWNALSKLGC